MIGVTGLPCAGKSHAAELLASGGVPGFPKGTLLKADDMGHEILTRPDVMISLREYFGEAFFPSNGPANPAAVRRAIAERVFADADALRWLEGLIHPLVRRDVDAVVRSAAAPVIVEAALLFAAGMETRCDRVLLIEANFETRLRRAALRGWDREELTRRERRQIPLFENAMNGAYASKIHRVQNDVQNDGGGGLVERLRAALEQTPSKGQP